MHDYLTSSQNDYYSQYPSSPYGWIYVAIDIRDMSKSKIGLTTKEEPQKRVNEGKTYNPFLSLFVVYNLSLCSWGISRQELNDIESYIHNRSVFGNPIKHLYTKRDSEWFHIHPAEAEFQNDWILAKRGFSVDEQPLYTYEPSDPRLNNINVELMKKIKTINKPTPHWMYDHAFELGMDAMEIDSYLEYLESFHREGNPFKVYLK